MKYHIDSPRIVFEQIENETILIDFDSGTYFSVDQIGSGIIRQLAMGLDESEIIQTASKQYSGAPDEIEKGVRGFMADLMRESILVEGISSNPAPANLPDASPSGRIEFQTPVLQKYTDMKDLLLLDPIHEVDDTGWPKQKPDA
jgi:hypothetical protein